MLKQNIRLGDILIEQKIISEKQLVHALSLQKASGFEKKLGEILIEEGYVTYTHIISILCKQLHIDFIDLYGQEIDFKLIGRYPLQLLEGADAIPFKEDAKQICIATSNPLNYPALEKLERAVPEKQLKLFLSMDDVIRNVTARITLIQKTKAIVEKVKYELKHEGHKFDSEESSIMQLIRLIVKEAVTDNASDIHIEPDRNNVSVRCRIDGILHELFLFDLQIYNALASRIKLLAGTDISERRKAQSGRFNLKVGDTEYDFRLSTSPTMFGESIVIRVLDQERILRNLTQLGFEETSLAHFNELIRSPYGIVLVTGPTGSGKTSTLYAALNEIKSLQNKMMTIEDPIEYQLPLVQQAQINDKTGFTFYEALKSFLRQDPDVIMIGEIRDLRTLNTAIQAAMTGQLVFSTLHTNDAAGAITRMIQMGVEPYLIADVLVGVVAQRLVRKNCSHCKEEYRPHPSLLKQLQRWLPETPIFYRGSGCARCKGTGFLGRTMITEILTVNADIADLISKNASKLEILKAAQHEKLFEPMVADGIQKVLAGIIPLEEVTRVTKSV